MKLERSSAGWVREPFCGLSHLVGAFGSLAALIVLLVLARGRPLYVLGFAVYGASLLLLYSASAIYHSLQAPPERIARWKQADYIGIYLLIAGTYVPMCLVPLRGVWGWSLLAAEYSLAALGIVSVVLWKGRPNWLRIVLYITMGWLGLIAITPLRHALPPAALGWLVGGGVVYSVGTIVYATDWPHLWPGRFSAHDLWHLFVMGGSVCHFILIACFVAR